MKVIAAEEADERYTRSFDGRFCRGGPAAGLDIFLEEAGF